MTDMGSTSDDLNSLAIQSGGKLYAFGQDSQDFALARYLLQLPPTDIGLSASSVDENRPSGTAVGAFSTEDLNLPDDSHAYVAGLRRRRHGQRLVHDRRRPTADGRHVRLRDQELIQHPRAHDRQRGNVVRRVRHDQCDRRRRDPDRHPAAAGKRAGAAAPGHAGRDVHHRRSRPAQHLYLQPWSPARAARTTPPSPSTRWATCLTASTFDFHTKSAYSIRVRSTDQGGLWFEKAFTVTVDAARRTARRPGLHRPVEFHGQWRFRHPEHQRRRAVRGVSELRQQPGLRRHQWDSLTSSSRTWSRGSPRG